MAHVRSRLRGKESNVDEPSLRMLRRLGKQDPTQVEAAVEHVFSRTRPARLRRLKMYALRLHSRLRPSDIARRYDRTPAAVTMAAKQLAAQATHDPGLAAGLIAVAEVLDDRS